MTTNDKKPISSEDISEIKEEEKREPKEGGKVEELQDYLNYLEKQFSEKRKEQNEKHFWSMVGISIAAFVLIFLTTFFYFSPSNQFSLPTFNLNNLTNQSTQNVLIDRFQFALVLSIGVAIIPLIVFSASRSRTIQQQNDELAALNLDIQRLRNRILALRQEEVVEEKIGKKEERTQSVPTQWKSEVTKVREEEPPTDWGTLTNNMLELLKAGEVDRFNDMRKKEGVPDKLALVGANLSGADLSGADLSYANLSYANLSGADLSGADLSGANLSGANLSGANLSLAKLLNANLSNANLSGANLSGANLSGANLSGAKLDSSIIIGVTYQVNNLKCAGADFTDTIIDDERLSIQLREEKANNISPAAKSKGELKEKLEKRGLQAAVIDEVLSRSSLPD